VSDVELDMMSTRAPGWARPKRRVGAPGLDIRAERMPRYLFIVSARHPWLYESLNERFSGDPKVDVVRDRRRGERREGGVPIWPDRRRRDRRLRPEIDEELRSRPYAIVILSDA
jgi:hypothetical protein